MTIRVQRAGLRALSDIGSFFRDQLCVHAKHQFVNEMKATHDEFDVDQFLPARYSHTQGDKRPGSGRNQEYRIDESARL